MLKGNKKEVTQRKWALRDADVAHLEQVYQLHRHSGVTKFLGQLQITDRRISTAHDAVLQRPIVFGTISDEMLLDAETYYTIAYQLLQLASNLMPNDKARQFKKEPTFRTFAAIRNNLVQHAYGAYPQNDPYGGCAWSGARGIILKGGTALKGVQDNGFVVNKKSLQELLAKYNVQALATVHSS